MTTTTPLASQTRYPVRACRNYKGEPCTEVKFLGMTPALDERREVSVTVSDGDEAYPVMLGVGLDDATLTPAECRRIATALLNAAELVESVTS